MAELTPLSHWLRELPESIVAVHMGTAQATADFQLRVQSWIETLRDRRGERWAVYHSDAYEFLAILCALWQLQRTACIPGDSRPGTVQRLEPHVDGFVGQFSARETIEAIGGIKEGFASSGDKRSGSLQWIIPKPDFIALEIYTSGSTGEPKPITKTMAQLEREIEVLESLWPSQSGSVVLATVSHQHIYGMMFRVLWPFCTGRAFERKLCEYSEDILHQGRHYSVFTLVSSPSHLGRINTSVNWAEVADRCNYVISSAAPLAREDSLNVSQLLKAQVREIYGSSETGAVAWRSQQTGETEAWWRAFPEVSLSPAGDGTLCIRSPYLGTREQFNVPDKVEFDQQGCFKLLGRIDRIVKVEGKRVSLAAIEQRLLASRLVKNAKALTIERKRVETAVVIQLTDEADVLLQQQGRKSLIKSFKALLAEHFEAVVLPRRWRFVEQMPYNQQGKLPLDSLQAMFEKEPIKWPQILEEQVIDSQVTLQCYIPADLIYFDGHFASNPILPGIVQVHWAEAFGRRLLPVSGRFERLEVVKFQQVIPPEYKVSIALNYDEASKKLTFKYESEKGVHSSGRLCFV
ncbi:MAG: AMP-binding protein [Amphritea sp.]